MDTFEKITDDEYIQLINTNRAKLYKVAIAILKNDDDACDAIQEALLSSYKNLDSLKNKNYFLTWLTRILINKCYEIINKNKRNNNITEFTTENDLKYYDTYKIESRVESTLNKIDSDLREIVILYYYNQYTVQEIADILGIHLGTVKSRLFRARKQIGEIIKEEEGEIYE